MAQKRSTGGSGTKRKSSPAPAKKSSAKKSTAAKKSSSVPQKPKSAAAKKKEAEQAKAPNNQLHSIILCAVGVFSAILIFYKGTKGWLALHNLLLGMFGLGSIGVPVICIMTGYLIGQDKNKQASGRATWVVLTMVIVSTLIQIFFGTPLLQPDVETNQVANLWDTLSLLFQNGKDLTGGGLISGIIALPLIAIFDITGAKIVISILALVFFMLLTNRNFTEILQLVLKPFQWIGNGIVHAATKGYEGIRADFDDDDDEDDFDYDDYDVEPEDEEDEPEIQKEVQLPLFPEKPQQKYVRGSKRSQEDAKDEPVQPMTNRRRKREDDRHMKEVAFMLEHNSTSSPLQTDLSNIDVSLDIPMEQEPVPESEMNALFTANDTTDHGFKMSQEDEDLFMQLVEQAAQEPAENANRLPWLEQEPVDDPEDALDFETDESIYDEEPVIPYTPPALSLLHRADNNANDADKIAEFREKGTRLRETLASFGVEVRIVDIHRGPSVTRYEIQPAAGVKISKITALADDIGLNLGGKSVRIEAPIPDKAAIGVEVPNNTKDTVSLLEILETPEFQKSESKLTFAVGKDIDGNVILGDIAKMPHMIIAGTTGSGKSVCTNSIIMSILYHASPEEVRLILVDPKVVEFQPYDGIPHLLIPVVTNPQKAAGALNWAVIEMERRYSLCAQYGVRDLKGYNAVAEHSPELKKLPQILIIIDEFADLMMSSSKEVEAAVIRIAQKARAAGIHLVIATQRPAADVITGLIKSNVPSRIGMSVKTAVDSRIILDCTGAETLLGNGDLLFYPNGWREPKRVQGCFCSDAEVEAVTSFLKAGGTFDYDESIMSAIEQNIPTTKGDKSAVEESSGEMSGEDAIIVKAAELAVDMGQLSTTALQRRMKLGYAKAARIVDELEERGIIGPSEGAKPRKVLMSPQELTEWKLRLAANGNKVD